MRLVPSLLACLGLLFACDEPPPHGPDGGPDGGVDAGGSGQDPCPADGGPRDAGLAEGLTNVCAEGLFLGGFGLRFADEARPLSRFVVHPSLADHFPEGCPPSAALRGATLVADLGAPGFASVTHHVVGAGGGRAPSDAGAGWAGLRTARGVVRIDLVAEPEASAPAIFDLAAAGMADAPAIAVVLDGLELDTDVAQGPDYPADYDPADGYTLRGVGAWVEGVRREGSDLFFTAGARFALGRGDDEAMNRALPVARLRAGVRYVIVALPEAPATGSIAYREQHRGHGADVREVCRPSSETTALTIEGADLPRAAPALTRFVISLFPDQAPEGDRVRELSIRIGAFEWAPATRRASMQVEGYVSNAGPPAPRLPMDYEVEADVALLQWDGTDPVESLRHDAPIVASRNAIPLPLTSR